MLSAVAHGAATAYDKVLHALLHGLNTIDATHANLYADLVLAALPDAARNHLEALMTTTYEYQSDFARRYYGQGKTEGKAEGMAEGKASALLAILAARQVILTDADRARVTGCADADRLDTWIRRAATATTTTEVFVS